MVGLGAQPLLERDDARAQLRHAVASAAAGAGKLVLVSGEAGIGKTALVRAFGGEERPRLNVLWGACDDLTVPEPLAPLIDLAEQTGGPLAAAVELGEPRAIARALSEALEDAGPAMCVIEDCHWADEATLDALAHVARRVARLDAVIVLTVRDDELALDHRLRVIVGALPREDVVRIALAPLSASAVAELAERDADVPALLATTGGNPFLVTEAVAAGGDVPATVRDAVATRAARLSAEAQAVLELVCVVPAQAELDLLEDHRPDAITECERGGLLVIDAHAARFRHELARRAYRDGLPALRHRELDLAVLRTLEARGADPARLVHHAEAGGDGQALARHALVAARRAAGTRSHHEAVAFYELALAAPVHLAPAERAEAYDGLAAEAYIEGREALALHAARSALALQRELGNDAAVGATLLRLARLHWWSGRRPEAEEAATEAVATLATLGSSRELAMAYSTRSQLAMLAQLDAEAIELGERAMALASELGDVETLIHAQTNVGTARMVADPDTGRALLADAGEQALAAGLDEHACRALHNIASVDHDHRRLDRAGPEVDRALAVAREVEQTWFEADTVVLRALLDLSQGRWPAAVSAIEALLESTELPGVTLAPATVVLATVELRRGGAQAHALVAEAWELARQTEELQWMRPAACLRAETAWLTGDAAGVAEATDAVFALALERGHGWDVGELAVWRWRAGVREEIPPGCAEPYARSLAGDSDGAAEAWEAVGVPYERALALCDAETPEPLLDGLALLDALGAAAPARLVRRQLAELGVRSVPRGPRPSTQAHPAGLSARQAEVLGFVAEGQTNADIARTLFLTPKTVEHHVTAILRKLRVGSRAEAVAAARDLEHRGAVPPT